MDFAQIFRLTSGFANKPSSKTNVGANLAVAVRAKQILRDRRTNKHLLQGSQSMAELAYEIDFVRQREKRPEPVKHEYTDVVITEKAAVCRRVYNCDTAPCTRKYS